MQHNLYLSVCVDGSSFLRRKWRVVFFVSVEEITTCMHEESNSARREVVHRHGSIRYMLDMCGAVATLFSFALFSPLTDALYAILNLLLR